MKAGSVAGAGAALAVHLHSHAPCARLPGCAAGALGIALPGAVGGIVLAAAATFGWHALGSRAAAPDPRRQAIPERVRHEVWRRDGGTCADCGARERLEFDHIVPLSRGGSNSVRNIELRCERCNRRKGARI